MRGFVCCSRQMRSSGMGPASGNTAEGPILMSSLLKKVLGTKKLVVDTTTESTFGP